MFDIETGFELETDGNQIPAEIRDLFLSRLVEATKLDPANADFPLTGSEALYNQMATRDAIQWIAQELSLTTRPVTQDTYATIKPALAAKINVIIETYRDIAKSGASPVVPTVHSLPVHKLVWAAYARSQRDTLVWIAEMLNIAA